MSSHSNSEEESHDEQGQELPGEGEEEGKQPEQKDVNKKWKKKKDC